MFRIMNRWTVAAVAALLTCGLLGLPSIAQPAREPPPPGDPPKPPPVMGRLGEAREIAALISKGQMKLTDAAQLAEQHAKGVALQANCHVEPGDPLTTDVGVPPPKKDPMPAPPPKPESSAERRLIYEIPCFTGDRIQVVRVDGAAKKVIDMQERKEAEGGPIRKP